MYESLISLHHSEIVLWNRPRRTSALGTTEPLGPLKPFQLPRLFSFWIMAEQIEHEVLVCDNGTGFVKCGFAGEVKQILLIFQT